MLPPRASLRYFHEWPSKGPVNILLWLERSTEQGNWTNHRRGLWSLDSVSDFDISQTGSLEFVVHDLCLKKEWVLIWKPQVSTENFWRPIALKKGTALSVSNSSDGLIYVKRQAKNGRFFSKITGKKTCKIQVLPVFCCFQLRHCAFRALWIYLVGK